MTKNFLSNNNFYFPRDLTKNLNCSDISLNYVKNLCTTKYKIKYLYILKNAIIQKKYNIF